MGSAADESKVAKITTGTIAVTDDKKASACCTIFWAATLWALATRDDSQKDRLTTWENQKKSSRLCRREGKGDDTLKCTEQDVNID